MPSSSRTSTFLTIAGVTVLSGFVAYAIYFDYKRRNDVDFRKKLRESLQINVEARSMALTSSSFPGKDKKRVEKAATTSASTASFSSGNRAEELAAALAKIRAEPLPDGTREREQYFMAQASLGEQLCTQGASQTTLFSVANALSTRD